MKPGANRHVYFLGNRDAADGGDLLAKFVSEMESANISKRHRDAAC